MVILCKDKGDVQGLQREKEKDVDAAAGGFDDCGVKSFVSARLGGAVALVIDVKTVS